MHHASYLTVGKFAFKLVRVSMQAHAYACLHRQPGSTTSWDCMHSDSFSLTLSISLFLQPATLKNFTTHQKLFTKISAFYICSKAAYISNVSTSIICRYSNYHTTPDPASLPVCKHKPMHPLHQPHACSMQAMDGL